MRASATLCYVPRPMGARSSRLAAIAALLLATLSFAGELAEGHHHDLPSLLLAQGDLPTFTAEHDPPDHTVHIEGATWTESDSCFGCPGCLSQQRQLAVGTPPPVPGAFELDASAIAPEALWGPAGDARRLKPSRAPPLA